MDKDWLPDQLKTCRNLIDIALILTELQDKHHLLPTILEILFEQVQNIVDENCVILTEKRPNAGTGSANNPTAD